MAATFQNFMNSVPGEHMSLPARVPQTALAELASILTRDAGAGPIELIIRSDDVAINVREFASYYSVVDRVYGRLIVDDLQKYSRAPEIQLKVGEFRSGSLEAVFTTLIESVDAQHLLTLWLFLKYLPHIARDTLSAYPDYEEGRLARARRFDLERRVGRVPDETSVWASQGTSRDLQRVPDRRETGSTRAEIRALIRKDPELAHLPAERVRQLARLLEALYSAEYRRLPRAVRFAQKYVLEIVLRIGTKERAD